MGFVLGVLFVLGMLFLFKVARLRGGWARSHDHHRHHHHHHRRSAWRDGGMRAAGAIAKRRLNLDEDQEGIVDHAFTDLRSAVSSFADTMRESRADLAEAFRGDRVDDEAIEALFARQDENIARARRDAVSALRQIHAVLDPEQRETAVTWLGARELRYV
jgi:Spy/CpxP family protein refolding chaperone